MKLFSRTALLACLGALGAHTLLSCSGEEPQVIFEDETGALTPADVGSLKLALTTGGQQVNNVTAVISGKHGFQTQTHNIDVSDGNGVISIFFGGLPEGRGYSIKLTAGQCSGTSSFSIQTDQTTSVSVVLTCPDDEEREPKETGNVSVTGTIAGGNPNLGCDLITKIVGAPSKQDGDGPTTTVELVPHSKVTPTTIEWSVASTTGATGTISNQSGGADTQINFDCTANGVAYVIANVTGPFQGGSCTEQVRAAIECSNQAPNSCGNGTLDPNEQCDGARFPTNPAPPAGSVCTPQCTIARCGDNIINQASEQCDGTALPPGTTGRTCNAQCQLVNISTPPSCGNNQVETGEQCDGSVPPSAPAGSACVNCQLVRCGDNIINQPSEQCDGQQFPPGTPAGRTCNTSCQIVVVTTCGNNQIDSGEQCDGSAKPQGVPASVACNSNCTLPPYCGDNVRNQASELCDGADRPTGVPYSACRADCTIADYCGDGKISVGEQCDGSSIPQSAPQGSTCSSSCAIVPPTTGGGTCGNSVIEGTEQCDSSTLPAGTPNTKACNPSCQLVDLGACGVCARNACRVERDRVDLPAYRDTTKATLDCFLGADWRVGNKVAATRCTVGNMLSCYCGTTAAQGCFSALPSTLSGQCKNEILQGTGCSTQPPDGQSACVAPSLLNLGNPTGIAAQYAQCRQDFCFDDCFAQ